MSARNAWESAADQEGKTDSERALTKLARKAFLSLWSYPNVYCDEGRRGGRGDGKELADLLVVFGNDVLIFSDKSCAYPSHLPTRIAWPRWYRRAIEKSAKQLAGAESFLRRFPDRLYLDKECTAPLPLALPTPEHASYHLVAVTRGAHGACSTFYGGGSSGSLMLSTDLIGKTAHEASAFKVGYPLESGRFVHVLDEVTADLLLDELDTVPDFVAYLRKKEEFLQRPGLVVSVPGEEDLLAHYMGTIRQGEHSFVEVPEDVDFVAMPEGDWTTYSSSSERAAKKRADENSFVWDRLIEHHSRYIRSGEAVDSLSGVNFGKTSHERVARALASQTRLARRSLTSDLIHSIGQSRSGVLFARIKIIGAPPTQAFVFLTSPRSTGEEYGIYRERRAHVLTVYCHALAQVEPTIVESVGIACEPLSEDSSSFDFVYVDLIGISTEEAKFWRDQADDLGILRPMSTGSKRRGKEYEFPTVETPIAAAMAASISIGPTTSRAERRRHERETRKLEKKSRKRPRGDP